MTLRKLIRTRGFLIRTPPAPQARVPRAPRSSGRPNLRILIRTPRQQPAPLAGLPVAHVVHYGAVMNTYTIRIEKGDGSHGNRDGHRYTVVMGGAVVVAGWTAGGKRDARQEATRALTEMGVSGKAVRA